MGSGNRVSLRVFNGMLFGISVDNFPFQWTVRISFMCFLLTIGLGRPYDA